MIEFPIRQEGVAWDRIEQLVEGVDGWTPIDQLFALYILSIATQEIPGDLVEVGSWCGRSAVVLASAARIAGNAKVHCVDLFPEKSDWSENTDGTYSFQTVIDGQTFGGHQSQTVWKEPFENQILQTYDSNQSIFNRFKEVIRERGMEDIVQPHRGDLSSFLASMGDDFKCRLAFLDGDHGYQEVREDILNIDKYLSPGGWICFDDAFTSYVGVDRAITETLIKSENYEVCEQLTRKLFVIQKKINSLPNV